MLKRLFTPLTLVNQLALIVLLATIIGVAGMAISARLVNGVQGSAHAINKAGSGADHYFPADYPGRHRPPFCPYAGADGRRGGGRGHAGRYRRVNLLGFL